MDDPTEREVKLRLWTSACTLALILLLQALTMQEQVQQQLENLWRTW
jgi:hypothetical protein